MARIYAKPIASGFDNTLILESREALVIPFDFSGGYTVARLTAIASMTSGTLDNAGLNNNVDYNLSVNGLSRNRVYFGFMDRDGFPGESGCVFIGTATSSGTPTASVRTGSVGGVRTRWGGTSSSNMGLTLINPTGGCEEATNQKWNYEMSIGQYHSGSGNYASVMGVEIGFTNIGLSNQTCNGYSFTAQDLGPVTGYNDLFTATFGGFGISYGTIQTIGYTHSGVPLTIPKYAIIYNPFTEYKLRIHSVGVFKVA